MVFTFNDDIYVCFALGVVDAFVIAHGSDRRKIRLIEGNAKCRHLKNLTCKEILRGES